MNSARNSTRGTTAAILATVTVGAVGLVWILRWLLTYAPLTTSSDDVFRQVALRPLAVAGAAAVGLAVAGGVGTMWSAPPRRWVPAVVLAVSGVVALLVGEQASRSRLNVFPDLHAEIASFDAPSTWRLVQRIDRTPSAGPTTQLVFIANGETPERMCDEAEAALRSWPEATTVRRSGPIPSEGQACDFAIESSRVLRSSSATVGIDVESLRTAYYFVDGGGGPVFGLTVRADPRPISRR